MSREIGLISYLPFLIYNMNFNINIFNSSEVILMTSDLIPYQMEVWSHLLGFHVNLYEKFCNPWRNDTIAGCFLQEYNDMIILSDFGHPEFNGNSIFRVVQANNNNCSLPEACQIIYQKILGSNVVIRPREARRYSKPFNKIIKPNKRNWTRLDKMFWSDNHSLITKKQLEFERCYPVTSYWTNHRNNNELTLTRCHGLSYAYKLYDKFKVYQPQSRTRKWDSNITGKMIGGNKAFEFEDFQPKILVITKSLKDYMVIVNAGYNCRFVNSESITPDPVWIGEIIQDFDYVLFLYDNDDAGRTNLERLKNIYDNFTDKFFYETLHTFNDPFELVKNQEIKYLDYQIQEILNL